MDDVCKIKTFRFHDLVTGNEIELSKSKYLTKLRINMREYYFDKDTGDFDGTGMPLGESEESQHV